MIPLDIESKCGTHTRMLIATPNTETAEEENQIMLLMFTFGVFVLRGGGGSP